ncbi:MAG: DUF4419 domain-containing protein [Sandaracinus sp.]|nr:DUF4419 domain-containing protein [Sandaracinus sp.]
MSQTFRVDRATETTEPPALGAPADVLQQYVDGEVLATSRPPSHVLRAEGPRSALVRAIGEAYDHHRALVLTPDAIWLTIAHGFSAHVLQNAERFRERLVRHQGVETLSVTVDRALEDLDEAGWSEVVAAFEAASVEHTGPGFARFFAADFSTSTSVDRTAGRVLSLAALSRYFEFEMMCICGIPRIRLEGTVEDWRRLRERVALFHEWDLQAWQDALLPICDELVRSAEGKPSLEFWRHVYKSEEAYGSDVVTGWLSQLFLFQEGDGGTLAPSLVLGTRQGRSWVYEPMGLLDFPATVGAVSIRARNGETEHRIRVHGGLAYATYDPQTREVGVASGWWVERRAVDALLELGPHRAAPREWTALDSASALLLEWLHRYRGQPILGGAFVMGGEPELVMREAPGAAWFEIAHLPDGRVLCMRNAYGRDPHVRYEEYAIAPADGPPPDDAPILARSTQALLERLVADPRFFDRD